MGMMKTIAIIRQLSMATDGQKRYGVKTAGKAIVFVETREKAVEIADTMNRARAHLPKWRRTHTSFYRTCVGPDHFWLGRFAPPLLS